MTEDTTAAISDEAVEVACDRYYETLGMHAARDAMRAALVAALPALLPTREAIAEVLAERTIYGEYERAEAVDAILALLHPDQAYPADEGAPAQRQLPGADRTNP